MASTEPTDGRCGALIRKGPDAGMYCTKPPMKAQARCGSHGGRAPQNIAAAARREAEAEIEALIVTMGAPIDVTPEEALQRQLRQTAGHCAWLLARVRELDADALLWNRTSEQAIEASQFPGVDTTREAVSHVWLTTYERHLNIHLRVVDMALKHDLGARMVRLAERDALEVVETFRALAEALGASLADARVQRVLAERLAPLSIAGSAS